MTEQTTIPATLYLPDGPAELLPEMAVYVRDGRPVEADVTIPDDLLEAGWFWWGSALCLRIGKDGEGLIAVATGTYPPPPYPSVRGDCYTIARSYAAKGAELAGRLVKPAKKPRPRERAPVASQEGPGATEQAYQMEMF